MAKVKSAEVAASALIAASAATTASVAGTETPKAPKEKKARNANITYTFQKERAEGQRFAPQAELILKHIQNAGGTGIKKPDLCKALSEDAEFKTKQPVERIVSYYQKDLVNAGLITQS